MKRSIYSQALRERRISTLIWSASIFALFVFLASFYSVASSVDYVAILKSIPKSAQVLTGDLSGPLTPAGYISSKFMALDFPIMLIILGIGLGGHMLADEEESGTLELLLASPVSRAKILWQKAAAMLTILAIAGLATWPALALSTVLFPSFSISIANAFFASLGAGILGAVFGMLAFTLTAVTARRGLSIGIASGLAGAAFFANTLAILSDKLKPLQKLSPYHYYRSLELLNGTDPWWHLGLLVALIAVLYAVAYVVFVRRDTGAR